MEYTDLEVWKEARELVNTIYEITKAFPSDELYGLIVQMRRCSISIPSNIAEGCGRKTSSDTIRFLHISRGSLYELETQVYLAVDQNYVTDRKNQELRTQIKKCKMLLNGFINYYKTRKDDRK
ncbi:four helix bundle protein [Aquimarina sp. U1-2]|uniref:four helix bundle protein n=1 Tax=Aquimarina sp. U1-2 TaxID=2823141 RepID=UPI001AECA0B4|nr:four helix bundle protein [Aquimarina sp. U1-2]MBP2832402.1 four helix bundle protein [Aquimarina sp. U1-2]